MKFPTERHRFLLRRWYWNQPFAIRRLLANLPGWALAVGIGFTIAWLAAQGV